MGWDGMGWGGEIMGVCVRYDDDDDEMMKKLRGGFC